MVQAVQEPSSPQPDINRFSLLYWPSWAAVSNRGSWLVCTDIEAHDDDYRLYSRGTDGTVSGNNPDFSPNTPTQPTYNS